MSRGLGSKQLLTLFYLLDRHGQAHEVAPVCDKELRARVKVSEASLGQLALRGLIRAHRTTEGDVWWRLTRAGLAQHQLVRISHESPALAAYAKELDEAGLFDRAP